MPSVYPRYNSLLFLHFLYMTHDLFLGLCGLCISHAPSRPPSQIDASWIQTFPQDQIAQLPVWIWVVYLSMRPLQIPLTGWSAAKLPTAVFSSLLLVLSVIILPSTSERASSPFPSCSLPAQERISTWLARIHHRRWWPCINLSWKPAATPPK